MSLAQLLRIEQDIGDLQAKHERARDIGEFSKYADGPEGFFRDVLRCEPWAKQIEMAEMVRDHRRSVTVSGQSMGKDWLCARLALWWIFARRGFVILTGPTERQTKHILMREVRRAFRRAPELPGELYSLELRVDEECGLIAMTSDASDKLVGFHHPRLLIAMTEAQGIEDLSWEAAEACCTSPGNRVWAYGNPTRRGQFEKAANSDNWACLTISAFEHPNVVSGREEIPGGPSREWVEGMRAEYGEGSSIYRSRVLALFPTESIEGLVTRAQLNRAFDRHESGELAEQGFAPYAMAFDPARYGPDSSVLAVIRGSVVEKLETWRGLSLTESAERIIKRGDELRDTLWHWRHNPNPKRPTVFVDETGLGGGVVDTLRAKGYPTEVFNGASKPLSYKEQGRMLNARSSAFWYFKELLQNDRVALPRDELLLEEALQVEWFVNSAGKIQILAKKEMRSALGRSPDRLDSVVIGLAMSHGVGRPSTTICNISVYHGGFWISEVSPR